MKKTNLLALGFQEVEAFVARLGWKRYRAKQILAWIYERHAAGFEEMTDLSKEDRLLLDSRAELSHLEIVTRLRSVDGTEKFLFRLKDGREIESVLIPDEERLTICISSQAGCTLDCTFCLTAQEGLKRNLKADEIVNQVLTIQSLLPEGKRVTNIVLMGMGEPLANLPQVTEAVIKMISPIGLGLSPRRVTISTAGLVPQILALWKGPVPVNLSISLNATTNVLRDQIMPKINRLYPLEKLMSVCRSFPLPSRRRITFEYVLFSGINDSLEDAGRLIQLTKGIRCKINLIPYNPYPGSPYRRTPDDQMLKFQNLLLKARLTTTIRKSRGGDILAACGQLSGLSQDRLRMTPD
ncbi:MAG: 23S rRNA (adenine(2503)-C(2))-methyltransferase RlmN [Nitrospira sp.]|nr:23S rRNA (adenine(2503)-C(2))-methyltransferase RlmN [Candidatus Manganitrophaceae bacterium]HIL35322.1 23S rRNA (adenine(2503)-C(2))-methyltransferase RlmN [Candidatus Manganitrophaceae bacterium]